jgi:polar amino acid transport system substrate-binding protein
MRAKKMNVGRLIQWMLVCLLTPVHADVLRVGWEDNPPLQMLQQGKVRGIDADLLRLVARRAGHSAEFLNLPWERQLRMVASGELDVALGASKTAERSEFAGWTAPYRQERVSLFARAGRAKPVASLASMVGTNTRIAYMRGSEFGGEFAQLKSNPGFSALLVPSNSNRNSMAMVRADRVDYVVEEFLTLTHMSHKDGKERLVSVMDVTSEDVYFMVSKKTLATKPALLDQLNTALRALKKEGAFDQVLRDYGVKP